MPINQISTFPVVKILEITVGVFPFKYLGCLIGPKRLNINSFQPLVTKAQSCIKAWNQNSISLAGRAVLINSVLMPITTFQLSCVGGP